MQRNFGLVVRNFGVGCRLQRFSWHVAFGVRTGRRAQDVGFRFGFLEGIGSKKGFEFRVPRHLGIGFSLGIRV